jgi:hypothetical protein
LEELKSSIERKIFYILTEVIDGVVSNFEMSLGKILDVRGQHIIIKWLRMLI